MTTTTDFNADVDKSELQPSGFSFSAMVGSGGVVAGKPVKYTTGGKKVVACAAYDDKAVGIAASTVSSGDQVRVLGPGCLVKVPYTLTAGSAVGISGADLADYTSGTIVGFTETSATSASIVRVQITQKTS